MSILRDIYKSKYSPNKARKKVPFSLRLKEGAFLDAIETGMGPDFIKQHSEGLCQVEDSICYNSFCEGFRLGAAFMLELR